MDGTRNLERWDARLLAAAAVALAWRALAIPFPHEAGTDPELVRWTAAAMGLWFAAWGLWAFRQARDLPSLLFACYGITACVHWGGPVGIGPEPARNLLLALYIAVSTVLNQSLFLHLAIAFPPPSERAARRGTRVAVYLPVALAAALLAVLAVRPAQAAVLRLFYAFFPLGVLYSLIGGGVWIHRLIRSDPATRRSRRLVLVVSTLVLGWLPHAVVSATVGPEHGLAGLSNLAFALIPPALAWALARPRNARLHP